MTRRFFNWIGNHQVVAISSLNAGLILCLAILAGLATGRNSHPQAWAMDPGETADTGNRNSRADADREAPNKSAGVITGPATAKDSPSPEYVPGEPPQKPPARIAPPDVPAPVQAPASPETVSPDSPVEDLPEQAAAEIKPAALQPAKQPESRARSEPPRRNVRVLRARPAPPIRRGRILRPRQ